MAYASRALTEDESRYAQVEKELLAATFTCKKFHVENLEALPKNGISIMSAVALSSHSRMAWLSNEACHERAQQMQEGWFRSSALAFLISGIVHDHEIKFLVPLCSV